MNNKCCSVWYYWSEEMMWQFPFQQLILVRVKNTVTLWFETGCKSCLVLFFLFCFVVKLFLWQKFNKPWALVIIPLITFFIWLFYFSKMAVPEVTECKFHLFLPFSFKNTFILFINIVQLTNWFCDVNCKIDMC